MIRRCPANSRGRKYSYYYYNKKIELRRWEMVDSITHRFRSFYGLKPPKSSSLQRRRQEHMKVCPARRHRTIGTPNPMTYSLSTATTTNSSESKDIFVSADSVNACIGTSGNYNRLNEPNKESAQDGKHVDTEPKDLRRNTQNVYDTSYQVSGRHNDHVTEVGTEVKRCDNIAHEVQTDMKTNGMDIRLVLDKTTNISIKNEGKESNESKMKKNEMTNSRRAIESAKNIVYKNEVKIKILDWYCKLPFNSKDNIDIIGRIDKLCFEIYCLKKLINHKIYDKELAHIIQVFIEETFKSQSRNNNILVAHHANELMRNVQDINKKFNKNQNVDDNKNINVYFEDLLETWFDMAGFDNKLIDAVNDILISDKDVNEQKKEVFEILNENEKKKNILFRRYSENYIHNCTNELIQVVKHRIETIAMLKNEDVMKQVTKENVFRFVDNYLKTAVCPHVKKVITNLFIHHFKQTPKEPYNCLHIKIVKALINKSGTIPVHKCFEIASEIVEDFYGTFKSNYSINLKNNNESLHSTKEMNTDILDTTEHGTSNLNMEKILEKIESKYTQTLVPTKNTISVYASLDDNQPANIVTSTPKAPQAKEVQKLNPEEIEYINNLSNVIREWKKELPKPYDGPDDAEYKDLIIKDLATDVLNLIKMHQLMPGIVEDENNYITFLVYKWAVKYDQENDYSEIKPKLNDLVVKLQETHRPELTRPQYGNRQEMNTLKFLYENKDELCLERASDILEDAISIWINELPSDVLNIDSGEKGAQVHKLAETLKPKLEANIPKTEIQIQVKEWLSVIITKEKQDEVNELAADLKNIIVDLPQDATIRAKDDKRRKDKEELLIDASQSDRNDSSQSSEDSLDSTMAQYIAKFVEYNHNIEDDLARDAFSYLLKRELQRMTPQAEKHVQSYSNSPKPHKRLNHQKMMRELDYLNIISDWLKVIPVDPKFNAAGNNRRAEFVVDMAKTIKEVEDERMKFPERMDYNMYLETLLMQYLPNLPLTISLGDKYLSYEVRQLVNKVIEHRQPGHETINMSLLHDSSEDTSEIHSDNIGEFIEEYIRINGGDIGEDELKMEAWCVRLLREIKCMVREGAAPSKAEAWRRLGAVPPPGDASVALFASKLRYIELVSDWIRNLPLTRAAHDDSLATMITELAETMAAKDSQPHTPDAEREFESYVQRWIEQLPLDRSKPIVFPVLMQQLIHRQEKMKQKYHVGSENEDHQNSSNSLKSTSQNPADSLIEAIKYWSFSLPIKTDNPEKDEELKDEVANKLYQKLGQLNLDPIIANDDLLYEHMVRDEVNTVMETLPPSSELDTTKGKLKDDLMKTLIEAKNVIKEKNEGEAYRHRLENVVWAALPPLARSLPEGELYKRRVADQFIVENLPRSSAATERYSRQLGAETAAAARALRQSAAARREGYGALFRVSVSEAGAAQALRGAATRAATRAWRQRLPLPRAPVHPLSQDTELAALAARIVELERDQDSDMSIHKEIMKWLIQQPISAEEVHKTDLYAYQFQEELKATSFERSGLFNIGFGKGKASVGRSKVKRSKVKTTPGENVITWMNQYQTNQKACDIILNFFKDWANQLPLPTNTPESIQQVDLIRNDIVTKLMSKVSELNNNPNILNDDFIYNETLGQEIYKLLEVVPFCCNHARKEILKTELINGLQSVKPLVREEQAKSTYKQKLNQILEEDLVPDKPETMSAETEARYEAIKEDIIDSFIEIEFDRHDDDAQCKYKARIDEALGKYWREVAGIEVTDPLFRRNRLVWALGAVRGPGERALRDELDELRVRREVARLFQAAGANDTRAQASLAKRLAQLERSGHSPDNDEKMSQEIVKVLHKIDIHIPPEQILQFVEELRNSEFERKSKRVIGGEDEDCQCPFGGCCKYKTSEHEPGVTCCKRQRTESAVNYDQPPPFRSGLSNQPVFYVPISKGPDYPLSRHGTFIRMTDSPVSNKVVHNCPMSNRTNERPQGSFNMISGSDEPMPNRYYHDTNMPMPAMQNVHDPSKPDGAVYNGPMPDISTTMSQKPASPNGSHRRMLSVHFNDPSMPNTKYDTPMLHEVIDDTFMPQESVPKASGSGNPATSYTPKTLSGVTSNNTNLIIEKKKSSQKKDGLKKFMQRVTQEIMPPEDPTSANFSKSRKSSKKHKHRRHNTLSTNQMAPQILLANQEPTYNTDEMLTRPVGAMRDKAYSEKAKNELAKHTRGGTINSNGSYDEERPEQTVSQAILDTNNAVTEPNSSNKLVEPSLSRKGSSNTNANQLIPKDDSIGDTGHLVDDTPLCHDKVQTISNNGGFLGPNGDLEPNSNGETQNKNFRIYLKDSDEEELCLCFRKPVIGSPRYMFRRLCPTCWYRNPYCLLKCYFVR